MKILLHYLKPYKGLIALTLSLAAINTIFSLIDPILFGRIIKLAQDASDKQDAGQPVFWDTFMWAVIVILLLSMGTAMVSRIAKNFQDYFANVIIQKFGAKIFTDGLQHAMKLPYQEFEDQRSGETLSILTKVRTDTEKFINYFLNALFAIVIGVLFVFVYTSIYIHWTVPIAYVLGIVFLTVVTNVLSKKNKDHSEGHRQKY